MRHVCDVALAYPGTSLHSDEQSSVKLDYVPQFWSWTDLDSSSSFDTYYGELPYVSPSD